MCSFRFDRAATLLVWNVHIKAKHQNSGQYRTKWVTLSALSTLILYFMYFTVLCLCVRHRPFHCFAASGRLSFHKFRSTQIPLNKISRHLSPVRHKQYATNAAEKPTVAYVSTINIQNWMLSNEHELFHMDMVLISSVNNFKAWSDASDLLPPLIMCGADFLNGCGKLSANQLSDFSKNGIIYNNLKTNFFSSICIFS